MRSLDALRADASSALSRDSGQVGEAGVGGGIFAGLKESLGFQAFFFSFLIALKPLAWLEIGFLKGVEVNSFFSFFFFSRIIYTRCRCSSIFMLEIIIYFNLANMILF